MTTPLDRIVVNELDDPSKEREWSAKPKHARVLRIALSVLPPVSAVLSSVIFSRVVRQPRTELSTVVWLLSLLLCSTVILFVVERQTRRFLPLVALLKLTMVFPDQAPSRFKSAMRAGSVRHLEERMSDITSKSSNDTTATKAAASIIELVTSLTYHDRRTRGHAERVKAYALLIGQELGLSKDECNKLMWAALLHDVGKVSVSAEILNKRGAPSSSEWEAIKKHPFEGKRLLEPLLEWMGPFANAAWEHHEKWNGQGYPLGLAGNDISLSGRVVALADAFEVMTATRTYKKPMSILEARQEVVRCAGTHFDPEMVRAFLNISLGRLRFVAGPAAWIAQIPFLGWTAPVSVPVVIGTVGKTMALVSFVHGVAPSTLVTHASPVNGVTAASPTAVFTAAKSSTHYAASPTPQTDLSSLSTNPSSYQLRDAILYQAQIPSQQSVAQYDDASQSTTGSTRSQLVTSASPTHTKVAGQEGTRARANTSNAARGNSGVSPGHAASGGSTATSPGTTPVNQPESAPAANSSQPATHSSKG